MRFLKWMFLGLVALVIGVVAFAYSGVYDVSAMAREGAFTEWFLSTTREHSVARRAESVKIPDLNSLERVRRGGRAYDRMCEKCHAAPGMERSNLSRGLDPKPPLLHRMKAPELEEVFWVTKHGIRMTGMPAWGKSHSDDEIWDVVAFVRRLPNMSAQEYREFAEEDREASGHTHSR
jgi:mono/diheme cytochrome c family protein